VLFATWIGKIREAGIRSISGNIIGDGRVFTEQYYYGGWEVEDLPYWYAAGSSGLALEENCYRFLSAPGEKVGDKARITLIPDTDYVTVVNETRTGEPGSGTDLDIVYRDPEGNTVRFARSIALDKEPFQQRGSVWDGPRYAAFLLMEALEREGIEVEGGALNIRSLGDPGQFDRIPPGGRRLLVVHTSPPLSRITAIINKPSHNFFADQVLRTLGAQKGKAGSFEGGVDVVKDWLRSIDAPDVDHFQMLDGSGLARRNYVQPRQFCSVLRTLYNNLELREVYYDSLPIAGKDGGLDNRMTWDSTRGNVHAKTGYIGNVRSLSGYVTTASRGVVVFSFLVNQNLEGVSEADTVIDEACRILAER
jgi:D-alanyl-D-alanine carboxypeptidase/D-alanyl-D-alanine-endopeptidase (penicillin-binding protein 4)